MGWSGSTATLGKKLGCLKEDLSPVHEEVPERWGRGGGSGRGGGLLSGAAGRPGKASFPVSAG